MRIRRYAVASAVLALALFHGFVTAVYISPPNLLRLHFGRLADAWMQPLFYQNWHLFSPNPGVTTTKLAVRYRVGERWSEWFDPLQELQDKHYAYRASGHGKLIYIYRDLALEVHRAYAQEAKVCAEEHGKPSAQEALRRGGPCEPEALLARLQKHPALERAWRFAISTSLERSPAVEPDAYQFKLLEFYPLNFSDRDKARQRWDRVVEIEFPPRAVSARLPVASRSLARRPA